MELQEVHLPRLALLSQSLDILKRDFRTEAFCKAKKEAHVNSRVASWQTALPLERRMDVTAAELPRSFAQKAAARRTHTEGGVSASFRLLCTGIALVLVLLGFTSSGGLCTASQTPVNTCI